MDSFAGLEAGGGDQGSAGGRMVGLVRDDGGLGVRAGGCGAKQYKRKPSEQAPA
jgi:hypothetical protein